MVVMARTTLPNFQEALTSEQLAAQQNGFVQTMIGFSTLGLPFNLDALGRLSCRAGAPV